MEKKRIMVVEDEAIIARDLARQLTDLGYHVVSTVYSGEEAVKQAGELRPDLVLMDIVLAGKMDGIQATGDIAAFYRVPVVYLTSYADDKTFGRAMLTTPSGYILKPVEKKQLYVAVELALQRQGIERNLRENHAGIYNSMKGMIEAIAKTIELRGPYTEGHHERIAKLAVAIARQMGLTDVQVEAVELASSVYDMGMINVPIDILQDADRLEGIKLSMYRTYPSVAYDTLKKIECIWPLADITLQHRECVDGSGFPRGIKGEDILIEARILAVAHCLEDLTTGKRYRNAFGMHEALDEISACSGSRYDPDVVAACLALFREKENLFAVGTSRDL
ncbi:MAG: response regulator [Deltaproteobacteria bacterium]|nr:response regulator [Deltaproteobacteria bacterium]